MLRPVVAEEVVRHQVIRDAMPSDDVAQWKRDQWVLISRYPPSWIVVVSASTPMYRRHPMCPTAWASTAVVDLKSRNG